MKLVTFNVNSLRARIGHVARLVETWSPDVLCLQETKVEDGGFPHETFETLGYVHRLIHGQRTYNGVAILSKLPLDDTIISMSDGVNDDHARVLSATVGGVRVVNLYVPNGQAVGTDKFHYKLQWLDRLRAFLNRFDPTQPVAVVGDLNIAPTDLDVWDPFVWEGVVLCHPTERARFAALLDWGLVDVWRERNPFKTEFSWWDYQKMGWPRNQGLRIDHALLSASAQSRCSQVQILREVRGWEGASDHAPVLVTFTEP